jgi:hypothetical protein
MLPSFLLQIFGVSHRSESCEFRLFFRFQAKQNFRFISNFASEAKVRAHHGHTLLGTHERMGHTSCKDDLMASALYILILFGQAPSLQADLLI